MFGKTKYASYVKQLETNLANSEATLRKLSDQQLQ